MTSACNVKVALITNAYAPYRAPVWAGLGKFVESLHVVLLNQSEVDRIWSVEHREGYTPHILNSLHLYIPQLDTTMYLCSNISATLANIDPDCIIVSNLFQFPCIQSVLWANLNGIPVVHWYESHAISSRMNRGPVAWLRGYLLRKANAVAVAGSMCKEYVLSMGVSESKITLAPNVVDVSAFTSMGDMHPLGGPARILFLGRYIPLKEIPMLIDAVRSLNCGNIRLRLVGHGPQEAYLREISSDLSCAEFHPPTRTPQESARHYAWADVVVMPSSREVWGLVINEALASGCYVISSIRAGVTPDLVLRAPLDVGRAFDPSLGSQILAGILENAINDISAIRERRSDIRAWGMQFDSEKCVRGLLEAVRIAIGGC